MKLDATTLTLFVRVAAMQAIGRAGVTLGLSSTNASQRVHALEEELGAKLLHRTTRSVSLTAEGAVFLKHAERILNTLEDAQNDLSNSGGAVSGVVSIAASASFGRFYVLPLLPEFRSLYPNMRIDLNLSDNTVDLVGQGYDLTFRIGDLSSSSLLAQRIDACPMRLVASPDYLAHAGIPASPQDLVDHQCIPFGNQTTWHFEDQRGAPQSVIVHGPLTVNLGDAIAECVLAGMGIGQAALWHAGPDIIAGRLKVVLPTFRVLPGSNIWAVRPPGRHLPVRVERFLEFMRAKILATNVERYGALIDL